MRPATNDSRRCGESRIEDVPEFEIPAPNGDAGSETIEHVAAVSRRPSNPTNTRTLAYTVVHPRSSKAIDHPIPSPALKTKIGHTRGRDVRRTPHPAPNRAARRNEAATALRPSDGNRLAPAHRATCEFRPVNCRPAHER